MKQYKQIRWPIPKGNDKFDTATDCLEVKSTNIYTIGIQAPPSSEVIFYKPEEQEDRFVINATGIFEMKMPEDYKVTGFKITPPTPEIYYQIIVDYMTDKEDKK